jgi:serine/threonine-protein kinase
MAEVVRAHAPGLGLARQDVALKLMHRHLADDPDFVKLFFREAQVASSLQHPNVVNVLESGEDEGTYYLAMEFVDGPTLRALIRGHAQTPFDIQAAVTIVAHVCEGLHHAHERKGTDGTALCIVHRDVSPGNVLLSADGAVKLSDFGVATATAAWTSLRSTTGSIRGKVAYMAPEQARGKTVDRRADVFSVGNILFELIEGRRLLQARGEVELLHELLFAGFGDGRPSREDCPPAIADAIARALSQDPEQRFASALEFASVLRAACPPMDAGSLGTYIGRFVDLAPVPEPEDDAPTATLDAGEPSAAPPAEPPSLVAPTATLDIADLEPAPPRRRPWIGIAAGVAVVFAGGVVLSTMRAEESRRATVGFAFAEPKLAPVPAAPPAPEPSVQAEPEPDPTPAPAPTTRRKPKQRRKKRPRKKTGGTAKPPPNESLFPDSP